MLLTTDGSVGYYTTGPASDQSLNKLISYNYTTGPASDQSLERLISDDLRKVFEIIFFVVLNGVFGFFGSIANIINIIVFLKQGLSDSVTISLFALAITDLGSLVTLLWESVCLNPLFAGSDIDFVAFDIHYVTAAVPHAIFVRIAWWTTTFITFERCLCIALPLKVKQIITPRRTVIFLVIISVVTFIGVSPLFICAYIGWHYFPSMNRTLLARIFKDDGPYIESIGSTYIVVSQFSSFILDVIFTGLIVHQLQVKSRWRSEATSAGEGMALRDKKVVKMVTLISCIFIVCLMPSCINFLLGVVYASAYSLAGVQQNLFLLSWSVILTLEGVNSSVNIFVYYTMSSNYRNIFRGLFCGENKTQQKPASVKQGHSLNKHKPV
ncbi:uncharacterized protein LOC131937845 [Physella acuta]|uniref:uncharacterized protein LOC131937845 n=1 Tax=Physella acuta TaxID=109671 RepID=UPI0027DC03A1|nr:uncharacterized protein LOC131937845 [Physella acuta]